VRVTGSLDPQRQTQLGSQVSGRVVAVMARAGDAVKEGDVLLQIDTESLLIQLNQQTSTADATRAQLALAESQLLRATDLTERGLSASSNLEQAQSSANALRANLAALEAQVEGARIALQNATVKSPMDGIISERSVQPGQTVQQGATLFTIVDLDQLYLNGAAPVGASAQIAKGQAVSIAVEGFPDRTFDGTVDRVNPIALSGTRTIPVYIMLSNEDGLLRGGMFATGQIVVAEQPDGIAVPAVAIREDAEGYYVLKLADGTVERQAVEQGPTWNGGRLVEITAGLAPGDLVVTAPLTQLQPGDKFEMVEG
jgi:RND family efflux transporter MFP subunit